MNNEQITPVSRFLLTIGQLPSSYIVSMTYEEQLLWLCNFLEKEVVPKTNASIEAVNELREYIHDYFENLDVTEEINNKLDDMVESGELQELLSEQYDELRNELANTVNTLSSTIDENTVDINELEDTTDNLNTALTNEITRATNKEDSLETRINAIVDSNPIPVASTDDMINQSRIYVNTTDGKWYYYDTANSVWTIGGTYQSTAIGEGTIGYTNLTTDLQSKVKINVPTYTITDNYYISNKLNVSALNNFKITSPIHLNANDTIKYTLNLGSSSETNLNAGLVRCDSDGNPLQALNYENKVSGVHTYTYKAPFDMYIRFSYKGTSLADVVIYDGSNDKAVNFAGLTTDLQQELNLDIKVPSFTLTTGHYISTGVHYTEANNFAYSSPILLHKGEKLVFKCNTANNATEQINVIPLAETTSDGTLVDKLLKSKTYSQSNYYEYTAIKDMYVAFCFRLYYEYIYICNDPNFYNFENAGYFTLFTKCACIGDSLTRGYFENYNEGYRNRDFGYPFVLSRMTNLTIGSFGHSGGTPSSVYTNDIENGDFSTYDIALILLGRNGGLSSDNDKTAYGNIISKLKTDNPNMQIFCLSLPYSTVGDEVAINERIQEVATTNFVNYVDIYNAPEIQNKDYRASDNVHYNVLGYNALARTIYDQVNKFIVNNYNLYKNMYVPKTLPDTINNVIS